MSDPRILDTIRENNRLLKAMAGEIQDLRADNKYMKEILRAIKKSVTRKYEKKEQTE